MTLQRGSGWWLGPLVINYGLVCFGLVLPFLALGLLDVIPLKVGILSAAGSAFVVPFFLYRLSWSLWLMCYYMALPEELPANNKNFDPIDNE